eukprot:258401_1
MERHDSVITKINEIIAAFDIANETSDGSNKIHDNDDETKNNTTNIADETSGATDTTHKNDDACIIRVIDALKYYQTLNMKDTTDHDKLIEFYENYNKTFSLMDDFIEIVSKYNNSSDLETIFNKYIVNNCDIKNCLLFNRHNIINISKNNEKIEFYTNLFDGMHCFLFHSFDIGMRIRQSDIKYDENDENNE